MPKLKLIISCYLLAILLWNCQVQLPPPKESELQLESQVISVKQIKESRHHQIVGYLTEEIVKLSEKQPAYKKFIIKNKFLTIVGFMLENGESYQYDSEGQAIHIGNYSWEIGIKKILGIELPQGIYFEDFEPIIEFED